MSQSKEEIKAELKKEARENKKKKMAKREERIKAIQKKKKKTPDEQGELKREMIDRAKDNASMPRNLDKLYPSQLTLEEMLSYCKKNKIEVNKGDSTVILRRAIKAFRNPAYADRMNALKEMRTVGKIVR